MNIDRVPGLNKEFSSATAQQVLAHVIESYSGRVTLASSLGAEDQVITHMASQITDALDIFILDTGRLHQETYNLMETTSRQYAFNYRVFFPQSDAVESMVAAHGPNHFYASVENRKQCCAVRKVEPLGRALNGYSAWVTGIRRAQSMDRTLVNCFEWDVAHSAIKVNPLYKWSKDDVWNYIKRHDVPYNPLHDQHYPSIGCAPCTRAVKPGEDDRSGRWWWEASVKKECGLHVTGIKTDDPND